MERFQQPPMFTIQGQHFIKQDFRPREKTPCDLLNYENYLPCNNQKMKPILERHY